MGIITGSVFLFSLLMCLVLNWLSAPPHLSSPSACCDVSVIPTVRERNCTCCHCEREPSWVGSVLQQAKYFYF